MNETFAFGPDFHNIPEFIERLPFAVFNKNERLGKVADWTIASADAASSKEALPGTSGLTSSRRKRLDDQAAANQASLVPTLFTYQHHEMDDSSFRVVDRQATVLRKSAIRSVRPTGSSGAFGRSSVTNNASSGKSSVATNSTRTSVAKRTSRYGEKSQRNREASIKVGSNWKLIEELDFNRMTKLYLEVDDPVDMSINGSLNYYDKAFDKVTVKTETNLPPSSGEKPNRTSNPSVISDLFLTSLAKTSAEEAKNASSNEEENEHPARTVISSDTVIAALMCCSKSVYSWDLIIDKKGDHLVLDKRDGGPLDFNYVNENASEPPIETIEKDTNINSHEALAQEATSINIIYSSHILNPKEKLVFENSNKLSEPSDVSPVAFRYRKWNLGDANLILRTSIHSCIHTKKIQPAPVSTVKNSSQPLEETALVNVYALNEFDHRAMGAGGSFEWRKKLDGQRGAVIATEMKNNATKLARWTMESLLSGVDYMRLGFVSRTTPRDRKRHQILGASLVKPADFCNQIAFKLGNGWGIVKAIIDLCFGLQDGKYVLLRDPSKHGEEIAGMKNAILPSTLQGYNNDITRGLEDLRQRRILILKDIKESEGKEQDLQSQILSLRKREEEVTNDLNQKRALKDEIESLLAEFEAAYFKIVESSQTLLDVMNKSSCAL